MYFTFERKESPAGQFIAATQRAGFIAAVNIIIHYKSKKLHADSFKIGLFFPKNGLYLNVS